MIMPKWYAFIDAQSDVECTPTKLLGVTVPVLLGHPEWEICKIGTYTHSNEPLFKRIVVEADLMPTHWMYPPSNPQDPRDYLPVVVCSANGDWINNGERKFVFQNRMQAKEYLLQQQLAKNNEDLNNFTYQLATIDEYECF